VGPERLEFRLYTTGTEAAYANLHVHRPADLPLRAKGLFPRRGAQAFNGRYELPPVNTIPFTLRDANGVQLASYDMQLSPYGTFSGEFILSEEAVPGYYVFENPALEFYFSFQVAEYRKPEINLSADFSKGEIKLGDDSEADVNARYFFDAPASDVNVSWALYARPDFFFLPGYETGLLDTSWMQAHRFPGHSVFGNSDQGWNRSTLTRYSIHCAAGNSESETGGSSPWRSARRMSRGCRSARGRRCAFIPRTFTSDCAPINGSAAPIVPWDLKSIPSTGQRTPAAIKS
jgi:hypothetical protein